MAKIAETRSEKIFSIQKWLGLHENPDGDTKLRCGEAAVMRNWKITRDGNLKLRPGAETVMDLAAEHHLIVEEEEKLVREDAGVSAVLTLFPSVQVDERGFIQVEGTPVSVDGSGAAAYAGRYWKEDDYHVWQLVRCESADTGCRWYMKRLRVQTGAGQVAGLWSGVVGGRRYVLAACDGTLWKIRTGDAWEKTPLGDVNTQGRVHMFGFDDRCYVLDGQTYRVWDGTALRRVEGYVPVVTIGAEPAGGGTVLEQVNKLTAKRRVWFSPDGTAREFVLPEQNLASVDAVTDRTTGLEVSYEQVDTAAGKVIFASAPESGINTLEVVYTAAADMREEVERMGFSELFNGAQDTRVFLYGDGGNRLLYSGLDQNGQARADYFPDLHVVTVGAANTPVTGLIRHFSRLMVYKTDGAYTVTYGTIPLDDGSITAGFYVTPVNRTIGNAAPGQVRLVLNSPRTLHGQDCYEWRNHAAYSAELAGDERQAQRVSDRVYSTLAGFCPEEAVCWDDDYHQEYYIVWGGRALVHNYAADAWYLYTDFDAVSMLSLDGTVYCGTADGRLQRLDAALCSVDGESIDAYWESGSMSFEADYRRKYSAALWVGLKPGADSAVTVTVQTDRKAAHSQKLIARKMASFRNLNFERFSFKTNRQPFMARLKIKAKKFTYYKLIFASRPGAEATVVAVDIRVRYTGNVK